jgi:hypothetical protein
VLVKDNVEGWGILGEATVRGGGFGDGMLRAEVREDPRVAADRRLV